MHVDFSNSVQTYTYHNGTGVIADAPPGQAHFQLIDSSEPFNDSISNFVVDAAGNLILSSSDSSRRSYLAQLAPSGQQAILTMPDTDYFAPITIDYNRNIYFVDMEGVHEFSKGAINFGGASEIPSPIINNGQTLQFSIPPGVVVGETTYSAYGGESLDFSDSFPKVADCAPGVAVCSIPVSFHPGAIGLTTATMSVNDANRNLPWCKCSFTEPASSHFTPSQPKMRRPLLCSHILR